MSTKKTVNIFCTSIYSKSSSSAYFYFKHCHYVLYIKRMVYIACLMFESTIVIAELFSVVTLHCYWRRYTAVDSLCETVLLIHVELFYHDDKGNVFFSVMLSTMDVGWCVNSNVIHYTMVFYCCYIFTLWIRYSDGIVLLYTQAVHIHRSHTMYYWTTWKWIYSNTDD